MQSITIPNDLTHILVYMHHKYFIDPSTATPSSPFFSICKSSPILRLAALAISHQFPTDALKHTFRLTHLLLTNYMHTIPLHSHASYLLSHYNDATNLHINTTQHIIAAFLLAAASFDEFGNTPSISTILSTFSPSNNSSHTIPRSIRHFVKTNSAQSITSTSTSTQLPVDYSNASSSPPVTNNIHNGNASSSPPTTAQMFRQHSRCSSMDSFVHTNNHVQAIIDLQLDIAQALDFRVSALSYHLTENAADESLIPATLEFVYTMDELRDWKDSEEFVFEKLNEEGNKFSLVERRQLEDEDEDLYNDMTGSGCNKKKLNNDNKCEDYYYYNNDNGYCDDDHSSGEDASALFDLSFLRRGNTSSAALHDFFIEEARNYNQNKSDNGNNNVKNASETIVWRSDDDEQEGAEANDTACRGVFNSAPGSGSKNHDNNRTTTLSTNNNNYREKNNARVDWLLFGPSSSTTLIFDESELSVESARPVGDKGRYSSLLLEEIDPLSFI